MCAQAQAIVVPIFIASVRCQRRCCRRCCRCTCQMAAYWAEVRRGVGRARVYRGVGRANERGGQQLFAWLTEIVFICLARCFMCVVTLSPPSLPPAMPLSTYGYSPSTKPGAYLASKGRAWPHSVSEYELIIFKQGRSREGSERDRTKDLHK